MRTFRIDDTSKWLERYGNGKDGSLTISTDTTWDGNQTKAGYGTCTGTSGQSEMSVTDRSGASHIVVGDPIVIYQSNGSGYGNYELNVAMSNFPNGTTANVNLKYPLQNNYSNAQVTRLGNFSSITVNSTKNLYIPVWTGVWGGFAALLCSGKSTITGIVNGAGRGFRGGIADGDMYGLQGEGSAVGVKSTLKNGIGGGGGRDLTNRNHGGGGGGHASVGQNGIWDVGGYGDAGDGVGVSDLTTIFMGGGGGSGSSRPQAPYQGNPAGNGGYGGSVFLLISKVIEVTGSINMNGSQGANAPGEQRSAGGGGAGGSVLLKGESVDIGTNKVTAIGGVGGSASTNAGSGGTASVGRIHVDYSSNLVGSSNPTIPSARQDSYLQTPGGVAVLGLL